MKFFTLIAVGVMGIAGCSKSDLDNGYSDGDSAQVTTITVESPSTRIGFEDNGTDGLKLSWEINDIFTIYGINDERVVNFKCTSTAGSSAIFTAYDDNDQPTSATISGGSAAIYPSSTEESLSKAKEAEEAALANQSYNGLASLDDRCYMTGSVDVMNDVFMEIGFLHKNAVMTVKFEDDVTPKKMVVSNGDKSYTVTLGSELIASGGYYTAMLYVDSCLATTRDLVIKLYKEGEETPYLTRSKSTSVQYKAGYRYTADITSGEYTTL